MGGSEGIAAAPTYPESIPCPEGSSAPVYGRDDVDASDGARLVLHSWSPPAETKAALLFLGGIGMHGAPYRAVAAGFTSRGIAFAVPDLRGHGDSDGRRGVLPRARVLRRDLDAHYDVLRRRHPDVPVFMGGESMGGLLASEYALERQDRLAGLAVMAPAFQVHPSRLLARQRIGLLLRGLSLVDSEDNLRQCSRDEGFIAAKTHDPKVVSVVGILRYLHRLGWRGFRWHWVAKRLELPLLVLLAGQDIIVSNTVARRIFRWAGTADEKKQLREWDEAKHTVLWDPDTAEIVAHTAAWVTSRA